MTTTTKDRAAQIEEYIVRDALELVLLNLFGGDGVLSENDAIHDAVDLENVCLELTGPLRMRLWPLNDDSYEPIDRKGLTPPHPRARVASLCRDGSRGTRLVSRQGRTLRRHRRQGAQVAGNADMSMDAIDPYISDSIESGDEYLDQEDLEKVAAKLVECTVIAREVKTSIDSANARLDRMDERLGVIEDELS